MITGKRKSFLSSIMAGMNKPADRYNMQGPKDEMGDEEIAAQDILDAILSKDAKALAESLENFYQLCSKPDEAEGASGTEESEGE